MRTFQCAVALAVWFGTMAVHAADVEFECDETMFERPVPVNQDVKHRFAIEGRPNLDSPLYDGLWPMTLEAFAPNDKLLGPTPFALPKSSPSLVPQPIEEPWQAVGQRIVCTGKCDCQSGCITSVEFSFVPNYDSPLFEGLWPITLEMFRAADQERIDESVPGIVIAANDMQPLRDSLWKATRDKFAEMEAVYIFGGIAFTR
jgi:hypothetical protein